MLLKKSNKLFRYCCFYIVTMLLVLSFGMFTSFAGESGNYDVTNFRLSDDGAVLANYIKSSKGIVITGKGKINVNLLQKLKSEKLGINDVAGWGSMDKNKLSHIDIVSKDVQLPDDCENLFYNFAGEIKINSEINTSNIINMSGMFWGSNANPDVSKWDVSKVRSFYNMFAGDDVATPNVSNWDVSNGEDFSGMFSNGSSFTPDVSKWDVSNGEKFSSMFQGALSNPDVSNWNMGKAKDLSYMFKGAKIADPDVSKWDVHNVNTFKQMFSKTINANPNVSNWNTSSAVDMSYMLMGAAVANPDVSKWDVSNVTDFTSMFSFANLANPDVSKWNTSKALKFTAMFYGTKVANPDVSKWDTSNATDLSYMFNSSLAANPNVRDWNTSNVVNFQGMFAMSKATDIDVSKWDVSKVTVSKYMIDMFRDSQIKKLDFSKWKVNSTVDTSTMVMGMSNLEELKTGEFMLTLSLDNKDTNKMLPKGIEYRSFAGDYDIVEIKNGSKRLIETNTPDKKVLINHGNDKNYYIIKLHKVVIVKFNTNCGTKVATQKINANIDGLADEPEKLVNGNLKFAGWYTESEFINKFDFSKPVVKDYELYAKWEIPSQVVDTSQKYDKNKLNAKVIQDKKVRKKAKSPKTGDDMDLCTYVALIVLISGMLYTERRVRKK